MKHHSNGPKPCCPVPIKSESFPGPEPGQAAAAGQQRWRRSQAPARGLCWTCTGFRRISAKIVISILPQWPHSSAWSFPSTPELHQDSPRTKLSLQTGLWGPECSRGLQNGFKISRDSMRGGVAMGARTHSWNVRHQPRFFPGLISSRRKAANVWEWITGKPQVR